MRPTARSSVVDSLLEQESLRPAKGALAPFETSRSEQGPLEKCEKLARPTHPWRRLFAFRGLPRVSGARDELGTGAALGVPP